MWVYKHHHGVKCVSVLELDYLKYKPVWPWLVLNSYTCIKFQTGLTGPLFSITLIWRLFVVFGGKYLVRLLLLFGFLMLLLDSFRPSRVPNYLLLTLLSTLSLCCLNWTRLDRKLINVTHTYFSLQLVNKVTNTFTWLGVQTWSSLGRCIFLSENLLDLTLYLLSLAVLTE